MAVASTSAVLHEKLNRGPGRIGTLVFGAVLIVGLVFIGTSLSRDLGTVELGSSWPYIMLGTALLVALGFEFVNGFHDTANAVATVIYTHSLDPNIAVVWSGFWNFLGVVTSTGAVAFGIVSLLPQQRGFRDGVCAVNGGHPVEPGDVVVRIAGVEFAHSDRLDHRGGHRQPVNERQIWNQRRRLGAGREYREVAAAFADFRVRGGLFVADGGEGGY